MAHEQPPMLLAVGRDVRTRSESGELVVELKERGADRWIELKRCEDLGRGIR